ncbi:alpha-amylase family glycosyl hydrolase [Mycoplasmopsis gallopavonis]|uniref:Pullulanase n=1 Tax=Mycoplasmopsis gallopavonis TaxID=76629 RepID=A0A449B0J6_9BACT|nr:alpha-amylase family glycosyl hydrolase [Mycoplasmopsis gallopavonis]VEU73302.1 Pullulanase [Mycoplasmopsis gallopavonis]
MNLQLQNNAFFKEFDQKYAHDKPLGINYIDHLIHVRIWQPVAKEVFIIVFDKDNPEQIVLKQKMSKQDTDWVIDLPNSFDGYYYQFKIIHPDLSETFALDPYALSMAPFDWEGKETKVGKGAFVDLGSSKAGKKPRKLNKVFQSVDPLIYELHVRDFTSLKDPSTLQNRRGTFNALLEANLFDYLKKLNFTHVQFLPLQSTYTVNDLDFQIYGKGEGKKWITNYNWGYDPHNYFSLNGFYSSNPSNPYARIIEFRKLVDEAHQQGIGVIVDVVYNHMMTNTIFNNILPGYYYREQAKIFPVSYPPLADERKMVKRIIFRFAKKLFNQLWCWWISFWSFMFYAPRDN